MDKFEWRRIGETIGVLAVVGSLIFVGLEIRQSQNIAIGDYEATILENSVELASAVNEHAGIWHKGRSGESLTPAETVVFANLVKLHGQRAFFMRAMMQRVGHPGFQTPVFEFAALLSQYPPIRREWERQMDEQRIHRAPVGPTPLANGAFAEVLETALATLDAAAE